MLFEYAEEFITEHRGFHKWVKLPSSIRAFVNRDFLSVPDILSLRTTSRINLKEQEDAYATGHVRSYGFDSFVYTSIVGVNWVLSKQIKLRSFTLQLRGLPVGLTSLHRICENNEIDIAKLMLACGTQDINELSSFGAAVDRVTATATCITAFHIACLKGHAEIVELFLQDSQKRTAVNRGDKNGVTPLLFAATAGHVGVVQALLADVSIDVNLAETTFGVNALYGASIYGHVEVVNALLADPRVSVNQSNVFGLMPLTAAAFSGNVQVLQALLLNKRIDVNQETHGGDTPLNISASKGYLPSVQLLLQHEATRVNQTNMHGKTPLFSAAANGNLDIVLALLQDGRVNVNMPDFHNKTPYDIALSSGHVEIAKVLLEDRRFLAVFPTSDALLLGSE
jgi:ankyrin repeat protein